MQITLLKTQEVDFELGRASAPLEAVQAAPATRAAAVVRPHRKVIPSADSSRYA